MFPLFGHSNDVSTSGGKALWGLVSVIQLCRSIINFELACYLLKLALLGEKLEGTSFQQANTFRSKSPSNILVLSPLLRPSLLESLEQSQIKIM